MSHRPRHEHGTEPRTIAVLGGGPRGISVVERLIANAPELAPHGLRILIVEPHRVGGGRVWDPDQPSHLLMNTLCADATHFTDETVEIRGPIRPGPTLYDWGVMVRDGEIADLGSADRPIHPDVHAEVAVMEPHSHPSRRFLGAYLEWCYVQGCAGAADGIAVEHVRGIAEKLMKDGDRWQIQVRATTLPTDPGHSPDAPAQLMTADAVVIATGHSDTERSAREEALAQAAAENGLWYGSSTNPISQHALDAISPGEPVIMRGLGMNFFDYMSLLTIGRGGRFTPSPEGPDALVYEPSGDEPLLLAGSGRGVPYRAKGRFGRMTPSFPKRYFTADMMDALRRQAVSGPPIDFREQMLDPILRDGAHIYYTVLASQHPEAFAAPVEELVEALDAHTWGSAELEEEIARIVPEERWRLDIHALDRPLDGKQFASLAELTQWWLEDLTEDLVEADQGMESALKCASVQIGAGRAPLRTLVRYGGLRGQSYAKDVEGWFRGFGGMLASGPPARRIEELIALVRAGVVIPIGARMQVEVHEGAFAVSSPTVPGHVHTAHALLEAHLPTANLGRTANPVLRGLVDDGLGRPFVILDDRDEDFVSGALEVGPPPYRVIDREGREHQTLYAVGVPLESILWGTQLQPLARTNSRMLREIDAVARDALRPGIDTESTPTGTSPQASGTADPGKATNAEHSTAPETSEETA